MELGITNPLQKFLKLKQPPYGTCPDPLFCWDVHRVKIANGKVLMIVSNASTCFVAITRMTAATWKRWEGEAVGPLRIPWRCLVLMRPQSGRTSMPRE